MMTTEEFTLYLITDMYEQLGLKNDKIDLLKEAIQQGHLWALPEILGFSKTDPAVAKETSEIMCMWLHIEGKWNRLSSEDRHLVTSTVPNWERRVKFDGFAGNDEAEYLGVARFLINRLDRFPSFKGRYLNSHCPSLNMLHRPMLWTYRRVCPDGMSIQQLIEVLRAPDQLIKVLRAPDHDQGLAA